MAAGPTRWGQHARRRAGLTVHSWHEGEATLSAKQECKVARLFVRTMDRAAGRTTRAKAPRRPPLAQRAERPGRQIRPDPARDRRECCGCAADLHLICCSPLRPATPRHAPPRPATPRYAPPRPATPRPSRPSRPPSLPAAAEHGVMVKVLLFQQFSRQNVVPSEFEPVDTAVISDDAFLVATREGAGGRTPPPPPAHADTPFRAAEDDDPGAAAAAAPRSSHRIGTSVLGRRRVRPDAPVLCGGFLRRTPGIHTAAGRVRWTSARVRVRLRRVCGWMAVGGCALAPTMPRPRPAVARAGALHLRSDGQSALAGAQERPLRQCRGAPVPELAPGRIGDARASAAAPRGRRYAVAGAPHTDVGATRPSSNARAAAFLGEREGKSAGRRPRPSR